MSESWEREPLNRIAPIVLVLLLAVAGLQVWSGFGGDGVRTVEGEVSDADLLEETTTTQSQRTFVTLAPLGRRDPNSPTTRSPRASSGDDTSSSATPPTTAETSTTGTIEPSSTTGAPSSSVTVGPTVTPTTATSTSRPPTTDEISTTVATTGQPTTTGATTTSQATTTSTSGDRPDPDSDP